MGCFSPDHTVLSYSPSDQVKLLDSTILNVANNFIPNNEKTFTPSDPPWITKAKKTLYNKYRKYSRYAKIPRHALNLRKKKSRQFAQRIHRFGQKEKENYLSKLSTDVSDPRTARKKYWTCLKSYSIKTKHLSFHHFSKMGYLSQI